MSVEKGQACERAREEYRNQLELTNNKQTLHYTNEMPAVFDVRIQLYIYFLRKCCNDDAINQ